MIILGVKNDFIWGKKHSIWGKKDLIWVRLILFGVPKNSYSFSNRLKKYIIICCQISLDSKILFVRKKELLFNIYAKFYLSRYKKVLTLN